MQEKFQKDSLQKVPVSAIVEYPTRMGNKCRLLNTLGISPYFNTEEEVFDCLNRTAGDSFFLEICLGNGCRAFYEIFAQGKTPFLNEDPVRLLRYKESYWVSEGKHRVCLAKRMGVKEIEAVVYDLPKSNFLLPEEGEPGKFEAFHIVREDRCGCKEVEGNILCLYLFSPSKKHLGETGAFFLPASQIIWLTRFARPTDTLVSFMQGIECSIEKRERKNFWRPGRTITEVKASVTIKKHPKTKIWLLQFSADSSLKGVDFSRAKTLYRRGLWREAHLRSFDNTWPYL